MGKSVGNKGIVQLDVASSDERKVEGNNKGAIEVAWKGNQVGSTIRLIVGMRVGNFK